MDFERENELTAVFTEEKLSVEEEVTVEEIAVTAVEEIPAEGEAPAEEAEAPEAEAPAEEAEAPEAEAPAEETEAPEEEAPAEEETPAEEAEAPEEEKDRPEAGSRGRDSRVRVIGVRFRGAGKIYYFDPGDLEIPRCAHVIVDTVRGVEYGYACGTIMEVPKKKVNQPLRKVLRLATEDDRERNIVNRSKEKSAIQICRQKIAARGLEMKLIDAEYTFDNSKILFYFTADGRVDFRELVKDLASVFHTRIELRQIGVRDETRILGGYGICGRPLCCHTWLSDFVPVSIKMAKEQNLSLNPGKISGVCGRLMCCLKNEADTYEELNKNLPRPGDEVEGRDGLQGQVESVNILRQTVRILVEVDDEKEYHEYGVEDITILRRRRKGQRRTAPESEGNRQEKQENSRGAQHGHGRSGSHGGDGAQTHGSQGHGGRGAQQPAAGGEGDAAQQKPKSSRPRQRRHRKKEAQEQ